MFGGVLVSRNAVKVWAFQGIDMVRFWGGVFGGVFCHGMRFATLEVRYSTVWGGTPTTRARTYYCRAVCVRCDTSLSRSALPATPISTTVQERDDELLLRQLLEYFEDCGGKILKRTTKAITSNQIRRER